jgi:thiol-disulfide isomerase/thioredoxin
MMKAQFTEFAHERQRSGGYFSDEMENLQGHQEIEKSVRKPGTLSEVKDLLAEAKNSCAVVFFTHPDCGPCKTLYPLYNELAEETGNKGVLIMVDVKKSHEILVKFGIESTPTFVTFLQGKQDKKWIGADSGTLRGNVRTLVQMAWPPHSHDTLRLPALLGSNTKPVLFSKVPPLEKLKAKMGSSANDCSIGGVMNFVSARNSDGPAESTLPDLDSFSRFLQSAESELPPDIMFTIVDLLRVAIVDPRLSGYYAEEKDHATIGRLISYVNSLKNCPYSLRLVTLQTSCNLFSSSLYPQHILSDPKLTSPIVQLITTSLLDDKHHNVRVAAASLCFNIAVANNSFRSDNNREGLPEDEQVELVASLLEAIGVEEESPEALKGFLLAFGYFVYRTPKDGELVDLLKSMDAQGTVSGKKKLFPKEALVKEIGEELLKKGLD